MRMGDSLGSIEVGKLADLIVIDGDPSKDIRLLIEPGRTLKAVMKDGQFLRDRLS